ncbi:hypothetical protein D7036_09605 [Aquimarina sp. BL5]|uniref:hypothetical protein n=1 Tax=Aquimarina sp. BL5 TaxID=1714860 RepID=UPI000EDB2024|nr:hypothetical protein [Aquimarina sp. BL5]RKN06040.1 hypothetical protein D7036_09605 [Aquimarina sp. BL5]
MIRILKKTVLVIVVLFIGFWAWYEYTYSMDTVIPFEVNNPRAKTKVLIASQGSKFKDSVVQGILRKYEKDTIYFKVIDVYTLFTVNLEKWDALILINSWEYGNPPRNVKKFIKNYPEQLDKLIILSTVGSSNITLKDVDVISGESIIEKTSQYTDTVANRLNQIIKRNNE